LNENILLITGLPRSGTTLTTWIINQAENCVALNEALPVHEWLPMSREEIKVNLAILLKENRQKILTEKVAIMKQAENSLHTNSFSESTNAFGLRESYFSIGPISIEKYLNQDLLLAVKHNAAFTALMPQLCQTYHFIGIIRNPLAVLLSWQTLEIAVKNGMTPIGEGLDTNLKNALADCTSIAEKQWTILNWFFSQFREWLSPSSIIKYEDVIQSNGQNLFKAIKKQSSESISLENKNTNPLYPNVQVRELTELLLDKKGAYMHFYAEQDILQLAEMLLRKN
jgi:hypothetical protein